MKSQKRCNYLIFPYKNNQQVGELFSDTKINNVVNQSLSPEMFKKRYNEIYQGDQNWQSIQSSKDTTYSWNLSSTYIKHPPFFEIKEDQSIENINDARNWQVIDTTRGWGSGGDSQLEFNNNNAAQSHDFGAPTSTGFTLTSFDSYNTSGGKFIYYAHA